MRSTLRPRLAVLVLLTAVCCAAWQTPLGLRDVAHAISDFSELSRQERELAPARAVDVPTNVLLAAQRIIPPGAVYHVSPGPRVPGIAHLAYRPLTFYWLFPRRYTNVPRKAEWVLAFGGSLRSLPLHYSRVWRLQPGVAVAEVAR